MRLTIIRPDQFVAIDGIGIGGVDVSTIPETISAVQWYEDHGQIEICDPKTGNVTENQIISDISAFSKIIENWQFAYNAIEQEKLNKLPDIGENANTAE